MSIHLSEQFSYKKLLIFSGPSIAMMIFTSIYGVVDGFFVSNFAGKTAFSAVNFIMPVIMAIGAVGFMMGSGGSALVAKKLGEGRKEEATQAFSMVVWFSLLLGCVLAAMGVLFIPRFASALGATGNMFTISVRYSRIVLCAMPAFILQYLFQSFFVTAERPDLGLKVTLLAGCTNMLLDALFVGLFKWGYVGAALATCISQCIGGFLPLVFFLRPNSSSLRLTKSSFNYRVLLKTCANGASEFMSNIAFSIVNMLYNAQLLKYIGEDGVSAYGVLMYVNMIFFAIFSGYSMGTAPVISYHYGANNTVELKSLRLKSLHIIAFFSVLMVVLVELLKAPLSALFVGYDADLYALTYRAFGIYGFCFLFCGFSAFGSAFFTALNNGLISASIAFIRSLVFDVSAVLLLPLAFGVDGIWASAVVAEFLSSLLTFALMVKFQKRYHY